jgi:dephospho-CoA kinase
MVATNPKIIGLVARSRSGKDTVADYIIDMYPEINIIKRKLAGPIKNAAKELYGFSDDDLETNLKDVKVEEYNCSPRDVMVQITKTIMDLSGTEFFTNRLYNSRGKNELTIIPDIRYVHDIERIHKEGGIIIKIERNINDIVIYQNENNIENMEADFIIVNNVTFDELYEQIDNILQIIIIN